MQFHFFCVIFMPLYHCCKTSLKTAAIASLTLLTVGCSQSMPSAENHSEGHSAHQSTSTPATVAQTTVAKTADSAEHTHTGVNTNHDVFHSRAIEVPAGTPVPAVTVQVEADPVRGWNLYVGTANFDFVPEKVNGESSPTEGHAHLYVNDKSVQRIYGPWTHLPNSRHAKRQRS